MMDNADNTNTVCIYDSPPDVEATFRFIGARTRQYADCYRPAENLIMKLTGK